MDLNSYGVPAETKSKRTKENKNFSIEDKITEHPAVKECVAVEVTDPEEEHVPMAFVVLNDDCSKDFETVKRSILHKCQQEMKEYEIPKENIEVLSDWLKDCPYLANSECNLDN